MTLRDAWEAEARNWIAWARSYFEERRSSETFERDGLTMTFASQHRSLEWVVRTILDAGLLIDHVAEVAELADPPRSPWSRLPLFLHLGALKARP